jgi:hypothetical protein
MSGLSPACVFRSAGTCHRFGFLPVGWAARLGVAGQDVTGPDVTGQDVTGQDVTGQDVAGQDTCRPVGTDRGLGRRRPVVGDVWD